MALSLRRQKHSTDNPATRRSEHADFLFAVPATTRVCRCAHLASVVFIVAELLRDRRECALEAGTFLSSVSSRQETRVCACPFSPAHSVQAPPFPPQPSIKSRVRYAQRLAKRMPALAPSPPPSPPPTTRYPLLISAASTASRSLPRRANSLADLCFRCSVVVAVGSCDLHRRTTSRDEQTTTSTDLPTTRDRATHCTYCIHTLHALCEAPQSPRRVWLCSAPSAAIAAEASCPVSKPLVCCVHVQEEGCHECIGCLCRQSIRSCFRNPERGGTRAWKAWISTRCSILTGML